MVSRLKHENVVELLGYCVDGGLRILAYEYAPNGSLHDILHGKLSHLLSSLTVILICVLGIASMHIKCDLQNAFHCVHIFQCRNRQFTTYVLCSPYRPCKLNK